MLKNLNPFTPDNEDQFEIWDLLIRRDFEAFLRQDWEAIASDYLADGFYGLDFKKSPIESDWKLGYANLETYRKEWIRESERFKQISFMVNPRNILYECCRLEHWQIMDSKCSVHKVFNGSIPVHKADPILLRWRSIFLLQRNNYKWKVTGFVGYMNL
jgi:hypothetical protein